MSGMYPPENVYGEPDSIPEKKVEGIPDKPIESKRYETWAHPYYQPKVLVDPETIKLEKVLRNSVPGSAIPVTNPGNKPSMFSLPIPVALREDRQPINVLDHGFVRLVDSMGNDLSIVRNARVSYAAEWRTGEDAGKDERLIRRLWNDKHTSPFEAVEFVFEVQCPIFVTRQWHRHRKWMYWALNEVSARYSVLPELFYVPELAQIGYQSPENKQGRTDRQHEMADIVQRDMRTYCQAAFALYNTFNRIDVTRELARGVLPFFTYTHFFAKIDLLNLIDFLTLRQDPHAQWEIRQYANAIEQLVKQIIPVTWNIIWGEHNVRNEQSGNK